MQWTAANATTNSKQGSTAKQVEETEEHVQEVQQVAIEFKEMHEAIKDINLDNPIVSSKVTRLADARINKATNLNIKHKTGVNKAKRKANECMTKGLKNISRAIGDQPAKPLTCVCRDKDTHDGWKKG